MTQSCVGEHSCSSQTSGPSQVQQLSAEAISPATGRKMQPSLISKSQHAYLNK